MKNKILTWDTSITVGDYVVSSHTKSQSIFKVTKISRRFLDKSLMIHDCYSKFHIGDEYNPLVTITKVLNLDYTPVKFQKATKTLDGSFLTKVTKSDVDNYIERLIKDLNIIK